MPLPYNGRCVSRPSEIMVSFFEVFRWARVVRQKSGLGGTALRVKRLTRCALLTAIALAIFVLEAQIPIPFPVPGMKLGLSNIITLFALFSFGWKDALAIVVIRILLGNLASGQVMALLYSLGGGLLSFAGMALLLLSLIHI